MTHVSLCSGIGGIDWAAEHVGFQTVAQVEIDEFCLKILQKHWPDVPKWEDIRDFNLDASIDHDKPPQAAGL